MNTQTTAPLVPSPRKKAGRQQNRAVHENEKATGIFAYIKNSLKGFLISLLPGAVLLFISAFIAFRAADPDSMLSPLSMTCLYVTSFIGGLAATSKNGGKALICGLINAAILLICMWIAGLFIKEPVQDGKILPGIVSRIVMILLSVVGGYIATSGTGKTKTKRRKNHSGRH